MRLAWYSRNTTRKGTYLMINSVLTIPCEECNSTGLLFFGNANDFDVETCECDFSLEQDLNLFNTPESN